jgi:hypothetical protein
MASLFRPTLTTYQLANGKHRTPDGPRVTKATPGAIAVKKKSKFWYGQFLDRDGIAHREKLSTNKEASRQVLAKMEADSFQRSHGVGDKLAAQNQKPLVEHLEDYRRFLLAEGGCVEHVTKSCSRIQAILAVCRFVFTKDITAEKVAEHLHSLRRDPRRPVLEPEKEQFTGAELVEVLGGKRIAHIYQIMRREGLEATGNGKARRYPRATVEALQDLLCRGIGASTSNGYLIAIKSFSKWMVAKERMDRDRLVSLSALPAKTDVRHGRRALPAKDTVALLVAAGKSQDIVHELTGQDR